MANTNQRAKRYRARNVRGKSKQAIGPIGAVMRTTAVLLDAVDNSALRKRILATANKDMGFYWINNYLYLRFNNYAEKKLGYKKSQHKKRAKNKVVSSAKGEKFNSKSPLVRTGRTAATAVRSANAHGTPKNVRVSFSQYGPMRKRDRDVLMRVPPSEVADMAKHYEKTFASIVNGEQAKPPRKKRGKRAQ